METEDDLEPKCSKCGKLITGVGRSPWWFRGLCVRCYLATK